MSKLYLLNRNRTGRLRRVLAVLGVFSLILTSAQLPALLSYGIASAAAPSTAIKPGSSGVGTGWTAGTGVNAPAARRSTAALLGRDDAWFALPAGPAQRRTTAAAARPAVSGRRET